jgi:hypothetical protein
MRGELHTPKKAIPETDHSQLIPTGDENEVFRMPPMFKNQIPEKVLQRTGGQAIGGTG